MTYILVESIVIDYLHSCLEFMITDYLQPFPIIVMDYLHVFKLQCHGLLRPFSIIVIRYLHPFGVID